MKKENILPAIASLRGKILNNKKLIIILTIGFVGIILIAMSSFESEQSENQRPNAENKNFSQYQQELQKELGDFLENINGAGEVNVMITFDTGSEKVYAYDTEENSNVQDGNEERKYKNEHIIVKNDSGEDGLEIKEIYPKVRGVAVICDNADNSIIKEQIVSAVCALFDINSTQISVASKAA